MGRNATGRTARKATHQDLQSPDTGLSRNQTEVPREADTEYFRHLFLSLKDFSLLRGLRFFVRRNAGTLVADGIVFMRSEALPSIAGAIALITETMRALLPFCR